MGEAYETGIRPAIDAYLLKKAERNYPDRWRASSAGYCYRKVVFDRLGVPQVATDARKIRVFEAGHVFHEWLQRITLAAGLSVASELEVEDKTLDLAGHFDDLIRFPDGRLVLYDYKTVNSKSFHWAKENGRGISHFHRLQVGSYMYMLRKKWPGLAEGRILKVSKDDLCMSEDVLPYDENLEQDVLEYWNGLNAIWRSERRVLPPCTCGDYEGGFMAREKYNPYFYNGEPCSAEWYKLWLDKKTGAAA